MMRDPIGSTLRTRMTDAQVQKVLEILGPEGRATQLSVPNGGGVVTLTASLPDALIKVEIQEDGTILGALTTVQHQSIDTFKGIIYALLDPYAPQEQGNEAMLLLTMTVAREQIQAEIKHVHEAREKLSWEETLEATHGDPVAMQDYLATTRALDLLDRSEAAVNAARVAVVREAEARNVGWTTPDGVYRSLRDVLRDRLSGYEDKRYGSALQVLAFVEKAVPILAEAGISDEEISRVAERGTTWVRNVSAAVQAVDSDPKLEPEAKAEKYREILSDARTLENAEELREKWRKGARKVPLVEYWEQDGVYELYTDTEDQQELVRSRMRGAWKLSAQPRYIITTEMLLSRETDELVQVSELSNPLKAAIHGLVSNSHSSSVGLDYIAAELANQWPVKGIQTAIGELERYGILTSNVDENGERTWEVRGHEL